MGIFCSLIFWSTVHTTHYLFFFFLSVVPLSSSSISFRYSLVFCCFPFVLISLVVVLILLSPLLNFLFNEGAIWAILLVHSLQAICFVRSLSKRTEHTDWWQNSYQREVLINPSYHFNSFNFYIFLIYFNLYQSIFCLSYDVTRLL